MVSKRSQNKLKEELEELKKETENLKQDNSTSEKKIKEIERGNNEKIGSITADVEALEKKIDKQNKESKKKDEELAEANKKASKSSSNKEVMNEKEKLIKTLKEAQEYELQTQAQENEIVFQNLEQLKNEHSNNLKNLSEHFMEDKRDLLLELSEKEAENEAQEGSNKYDIESKKEECREIEIDKENIKLKHSSLLNDITLNEDSNYELEEKVKFLESQLEERLEEEQYK